MVKPDDCPAGMPRDREPENPPAPFEDDLRQIAKSTGKPEAEEFCERLIAAAPQDERQEAKVLLEQRHALYGNCADPAYCPAVQLAALIDSVCEQRDDWRVQALYETDVAAAGDSGTRACAERARLPERATRRC